MSKKLLIDNNHTEKNEFLKLDFTDVILGAWTQFDDSNYNLDGSLTVTGTWYVAIKMDVPLVIGHKYRLSATLLEKSSNNAVKLGFTDKATNHIIGTNVSQPGDVCYDFEARAGLEYLMIYTGSGYIKYNNFKIVERS